MKRMLGRRVWIAVGVGAGIALAGAAGAQTSIVLPRPGQVGIGVGGNYGALMKQGPLGGDYGSGPGLSVRLRYRMRFERAAGLSFDSQTFDAREAKLVSGSAFDVSQNVRLKTATLILSGVDIYQMFGTRTRTTKMLHAGIGLAQVSLRHSDGETEFPGDGLYLSAGVGVERFVYRSWAYDLGVRYLSVFQEGRANHDLQASLGLVFYASY